MLTAIMLISCEKEKVIEDVPEFIPEEYVTEILEGGDMSIFNGIQYDAFSFKNVVFSFLGYAPPYHISYCDDRLKTFNISTKYKPIVSPSLTPLTDEQRKQLDWGYRIPQGIPLTDLVNGYLGRIPSSWNAPSGESRLWMNGWYYIPPYGGWESVFRLSDFIGYNHYSSKDFGQLNLPREINQNTQELRIGFATLGDFQLTDFSSFSTLHWGIAAIPVSGGTIKYKSIPEAEDNYQSIKLTSSEIAQMFPSNTTYVVVPYMTSYNAQNLLPTMEGYNTVIQDAVSLPQEPQQVIKTTITGEREFTANVTINSYSRTNVNVTVTVRNTTETVKVFRLGSLRYNFNGSDYYGNRYNSDDFMISSTEEFSVYPGETVTVINNRYLAHGAGSALQTPYSCFISILYPNSINVLSQIGSGSWEQQ